MSEPWPLIEVAGAPRERGRRYGEAARDRVRKSLDYYRDAYVTSAGRPWDEALAQAMGRLPLVESYVPEVLEEVRGIAEGAGRRFEEMVWLNDRIPPRRATVEPPTDGCTSFAVLPVAAGDGHTYCGQNWDWRTDVLETIVFLRVVQPPKPTIVMQVEAGQVARQGANGAGIALNANALPGAGGSAPGIAGPYVRRAILDASTMRDALLAVVRAGRSVRSNLLISHRDGVAIDIETTPARQAAMHPSDGLLVHGNHFAAMVPDDGAQFDGSAWLDSLYRVPRVRDALAGSRAATTGERMRALIASALSDHFGRPHSVCRHPDGAVSPALRTETLVSSIVDLTSGEYWATLGPPCATEYRKLPWALYADDEVASARG